MNAKNIFLRFQLLLKFGVKCKENLSQKMFILLKKYFKRKIGAGALSVYVFRILQGITRYRPNPKSEIPNPKSAIPIQVFFTILTAIAICPCLRNTTKYAPAGSASPRYKSARGPSIRASYTT